MDARQVFILDVRGWADVERGERLTEVLRLIVDAARVGCTDIPWNDHDGWPSEVAAAAARLRDRFVPATERAQEYMQTGDESLDDPFICEDFVRFLPYAWSATLQAKDGQLASLADTGTSVELDLTEDEARKVAEAVGPDRLFRDEEWRRQHPSPWQRFLGWAAQARGASG